MTEQIQKAESLLEKLQKVILELRQNQEHAVAHTAEMLPELVQIFQTLFGMAETETKEVEIPTGILLQQLENFEQFYQQGDTVQLADTLEYEIKETVSFYLEILENMEQR